MLATIRRRRATALALFLAILLVGSAIVLLLPRSYATSSEILIKRADTALQSTTYPQIDALLTWNRDTATETYIALAHQPAIADRVIADLGLRTTSKELLSKSIVVTPVTNSDIIRIEAEWRDPRGSADIANAFARAFIERQRMLAASEATEAAASLSIALNRAQSDLSRAETNLTVFESRYELTDASTQTASILSAIADIQSKIRAGEAESAQAQAQLSSIGSDLAALPRTIDASKVFSTDPTTDQIEQQLAQQRLQLAVLRQQFTEKYPDLIATKKQIASLEAALKSSRVSRITSTTVEPNPLNAGLTNQAATLRAQIAGNSAQLTALREEESDLLAKLRVFPGDLSQLSSLQRRVKSAEAIYDALQSNYFNAVVAKSMAVSDLSVVQNADAGSATVKPPRLLALAMVALVAFLISLATVAIVEWASSSPALAEAG